MKKYLALVLVAVMLLSLVACGGDTTTDTSKDASVNNTESVADTTVSTDETSSEEEPVDDTPSTSNTAKVAEKIGSIDMETMNVGLGEGGLYYVDDNGMYGIMTFDGKNDTGAKYTFCVPAGECFVVSTASLETYNLDDVSTLNVFGLVDVTGKEIIPQKFADFSVESERFIAALEAVAKTDNEDEAVVTLDDTHYAGNAYLYDTISGEHVTVVDDTVESLYYKGDAIRINKGNGYEWYNVNSEKLPVGATVFQNGWYALAEGPEVVVYDAEKNKQFSVESDGFIPYESEGRYLYAKKETNDNEIYVVMDKKGNVISAEFDPEKYDFSIFGDLVEMDGKIYNFKGENIIEGTFESYYNEEVFGEVYVLRNGKDCTLIDKNGTVLWQGTEDDKTFVDYYDSFTIYYYDNANTVYYSVKDKDFTLRGREFAPTMVMNESANGVYNVVSTLTGETYVKGYQNYTYAADSEIMYIYAITNTKVDIYLVK